MSGLGLITLQRRMRELGRIRLGEKGVAENGKTFPKKLTGFRLTSPSEETLIVAASLYGGEVRRWEGAPGEGKQWELYIGDRIDVLLPPGETLSQSFEMWSGGGCVRRCNGAVTDDGEACLCPSDIEEKMAAAAKGKACKPTTRLGVILPRLPDVGVWRMESHGYNAAVELPGTVEVLKALAGAGRMVPAFLRIDQRTSVKDGQTRHFIVPVLELPSVTVAELTAGSASLAVGPAPDTSAINASSTPALPAGPSVSQAKAPTRPALPSEEPADPVFVESLRQRLNGVTPAERFKECKRGFLDRFGRPDQLSASQAHAAEAYVAGWEKPAAVEAEDAGAPFDAPAEAAPKVKRSLTTAAKLHVHAKACGLTEADLDALILNDTLGETSSAKDLDEATLVKVWQAVDDVKNGRLDMGVVHEAVALWMEKKAAEQPVAQ